MEDFQAAFPRSLPPKGHLSRRAIVPTEPRVRAHRDAGVFPPSRRGPPAGRKRGRYAAGARLVGRERPRNRRACPLSRGVCPLNRRVCPLNRGGVPTKPRGCAH